LCTGETGAGVISAGETGGVAGETVGAEVPIGAAGALGRVVRVTTGALLVTSDALAFGEIKRRSAGSAGGL
jgi:hypothetical protein